jgi:hypothetical protein
MNHSFVRAFAHAIAVAALGALAPAPGSGLAQATARQLPARLRSMLGCYGCHAALAP